MVRRIEIQPRSVFWSESGELVAITTDDGYFVLSFDANAVANATEEDTNEDGVESAFDVSARDCNLKRSDLYSFPFSR